MTDFAKLSHTVDSWQGKPSRVASAPKSLPKKGNVLDKMSVEEPAKKALKVLILDDVQIQKIMTAPRDEKRKILSRLTDSQRRRVLARFSEIQKVKDDESVDKLNLVNLDSLLNNCIYSPDDYNMNLLSQWKSMYEVPTEIEPFVTAVENLDREGIESNLESYKQFCDDKGIHTQVNLIASALGGENAPDALPDEGTEDLGDFDEGAEPMDSLPDEGGFDDFEEPDFEEPEFEEPTDDILDSIRKYAINDCLTFIVSGSKDIWSVVDSSVNHLASKFNCSYGDVAKVYSEAWSEKFSTYQKSVMDSKDAVIGKLTARRVMDAIIDEIAEKPLLDPYTGEEVQSEEDKPILQALSEALEAYANGNHDLLDQIATTTLAGDSTEEPLTEDDMENEGDEFEDFAEPETDEEDTADDFEDSENIGDSSPIALKDPVKKAEEAEKEQEAEDNALAKELAELIKSIMNGEGCEEIEDSSRINTIIDKLYTKVPALRKYNFKVSDCAPVMCPCEAPVSSINPPMTRSEYYDMCPVCPDYFDLVVAQYADKQMCPNCQEYQVNPNGLCVNPSTCPQVYYPYNCSMDELSALLGGAQPDEYTSIINANCCPMSDALKVAALTNNLSFIDNTFYKKHVGDSAWCYDEVPSCLKSFTDKPGSIKLVTKKTDSAINLFGQYFELC